MTTTREHIDAAESLLAKATKLISETTDMAGSTAVRNIYRADTLNGIAQTHIMLAQYKNRHQ